MHMEVMELSFQDIPSDPQGRSIFLPSCIGAGESLTSFTCSNLHRFDFDCEISIVKEGDAGSVGIGNVLIESQTLHVMLEVDLLKTQKICQVLCATNSKDIEVNYSKDIEVSVLSATVARGICFILQDRYI
ncbi:hypothetical protein DM860_006384 [Cuscuta australis]|uniref:Uncharacterized protein n=1 Tax=Cuscuta australis TaxID=267555 RepID=A0A328D4H6_9ASTE|nr:hypothetical protein DM860_006384 [Cuscuta australis]